MKKFLALSLFAAIGLGVVRHAVALDTTNGMGAAVNQHGGTIEGGAGIQYGINPGAQAVDVIPLTAAVTITQGDALVLVAGKSCSKTTTVGDVNFIGFAAEDAAFGAIAKVVRRGIFAARIGTSTTVGDKLVMSANPGFLTPSSAVTGASYTSLSSSPIVATAFVTYTYVTYAPTVLIFR